MSSAELMSERERIKQHHVRSLAGAAQKAAGPLVLLLIVIAFFWKIVLTNQYSWIESPDLANQVVPWLNYEAQQFHMHRFPIWDPFLFGGQSLIGQGQPGLAYPLNWLLFALPLRDGHLNIDILNWYYLSIHYFAALFCYLLCRDLGRGRIASVLAGVAFGLGGYIGNTDWPQMINGAIWGPLVFLFLFRVGRGVRPIASSAFCGLFLGVSWLSGHHQIPIFLTLATCGAWVYFLFEHGRLKPSLLKPAAVFLVFFVCAGALQIWPAYEYGHLALRWVGSQHDPVAWNEPVPYTVHQLYSISPIYLLGILIPGYYGSVFVGVVALALASLALVCWWKTREVRVIFGVGVAGLFLALANNDVFHGMMYAIVPFIDKARSPGAAFYLSQFAIATLLAFGLDTIFLPDRRPVLRPLARILLAFGVLVLLILFAVELGHALGRSFDDRVGMCPLAAFALAALIYRSSRNGSSLGWIGALIIGVYLLELGNVSLYAVPTKDHKELAIYRTAFDTTKPVADFLRSQPGLLRAEVSREAVWFNFGDWYGLDSMDGILPSLPSNFCNLDFGSRRTLMLYGTNYTISRKPTMDGQQELFRDDSGLLVFKNPDAFPRVWTVHEALQVKDPAGASRLSQDNNFDLRKKTFSYQTPPRMEQCDGDAVRSFERDINATTLVVDMKCRGIVVQSENNAPGWIATVDGARTPIYEAYTTLRGVVAGPGEHKIEMHYRPLSVIGGGVATGLAFLGALLFLVAPLLRRPT